MLMLRLEEALPVVRATEQVTDQVRRLLGCLKGGPFSPRDAMARLQLRYRPTLASTYLQPALDAGLFEMTQPESPNSPSQKYRLTSMGLIQK